MEIENIEVLRYHYSVTPSSLTKISIETGIKKESLEYVKRNRSMGFLTPSRFLSPTLDIIVKGFQRVFGGLSF